MKNISLKSVAILGTSLAMLTSCNNWKELAKDNYSVTPNPLEVHGGKVEIDVKGQFPPKAFKKNVALEITPELRYEGGVAAYKTATFQGEEFPGNNDEVPYETGKTVSRTDAIDYKPGMENSTLYVKLVGLKGDKSKDVGELAIAKGVITTSLLVQDDFMPIMAQDKFERITKHSQSAIINFAKNSYVVRSAELRDEDYKAAVELIDATAEDENRYVTTIDLIGFASPEGEISFNENLSSDRANAVSKKLDRVFKKAKIEIADRDAFYAIKGEGADWNGFYELLSNSTLEDKAMIRRSLDDQPLLATKEKTLASLSSTYDEIEKDLLPQLRRTEVVVNYDIVGKTDAQILELARTNAAELNVEELLFAATLVSDNNEKMDFYKKAERIFGSDYRGATNVAYLMFMSGDKEGAAAKFKKAYGIEQNDITTNNVAVISALNGDNDEAMDMWANATLPNAVYNRGVLEIKAGEYDKAKADMNGVNTFNTALVKVLTKDYDGAIATLNAANDNSGIADYLRAIASMRKGNTADAKKFIESAGSKDAALATKAAKDLEFAAMMEAPVEEGR